MTECVVVEITRCRPGPSAVSGTLIDISLSYIRTLSLGLLIRLTLVPLVS